MPVDVGGTLGHTSSPLATAVIVAHAGGGRLDGTGLAPSITLTAKIRAASASSTRDGREDRS
jgi:hypothetical protein